MRASCLKVELLHEPIVGESRRIGGLNDKNKVLG